MLFGEIRAQGPDFTSAGSFFTGLADNPVELVWRNKNKEEEDRKRTLVLASGGPVKSIAAIGFDLGKQDVGVLVLTSTRKNFFSSSTVEFYESIAQFLSVSILHQQKQLALGERVKELTCLYGIARLIDDPSLSFSGVLKSAVELLPRAWLHPDITSARIEMDGVTSVSTGFSEGCQRLRSDIVSEGRERGFVEVTYDKEMPELDEGPFLLEERNLLDAVAKEVLLIADKYRAASEREQLQDQLRHADRLATIGQLSAGVAHELNEPLGGILGFAQLCEKHPGLPAQVRRDVEKIISASLHAREVVRKLMLFARQTPPERAWVDLNMLIEDGLYFIESRCQKSGIDLVRQLDEDLAEINADPGQVYQVIINLAVNGIQAMPQGGCLKIYTACGREGNRLVVEDSGVGMSSDVSEKIFTPFFTTKDVGEGTGLGLSVVEGIVNSHGGSITVESTLGVGTKFTVYWPTRVSA
jgi:signal transduction histidine kinase